MKNVMKQSLVILALFTALYTYAGEVITFSSNDVNAKSLVKIQQISEGTHFSIKDEDGITLYQETINNSGIVSKLLDFSTLPDADYYFELDSEEKIKVIPFSVNKSVAEFVAAEEYSIVKPKIVVNDQLVHISNDALENQKVDVKVYYENDDLAFRELLQDAKAINRTYDFSSSLKGNYTIVLTKEGRTFVDNIYIP
ncbi:hypothetical protein HNS38_09100 [Lentimicrobium sp. L6]|uniref:hypothetical protein n=1 Tax=Lentimicrobium sp. L6 TaxID=2735916 RepID=UPI001551720A|nr:hypothetical protein [Lentimicrobium sp. L6]NPD84913.1 hypothetical protein [Lentimicrobium sp. L6]